MHTLKWRIIIFSKKNATLNSFVKCATRAICGYAKLQLVSLSMSETMLGCWLIVVSSKWGIAITTATSTPALVDCTRSAEVRTLLAIEIECWPTSAKAPSVQLRFELSTDLRQPDSSYCHTAVSDNRWRHFYLVSGTNAQWFPFSCAWDIFLVRLLTYKLKLPLMICVDLFHEGARIALYQCWGLCGLYCTQHTVERRYKGCCSKKQVTHYQVDRPIDSIKACQIYFHVWPDLWRHFLCMSREAPIWVDRPSVSDVSTPSRSFRLSKLINRALRVRDHPLDGY